MAKIIVIGNQKGGSGKTTTTIHLASGLFKDKKKVLVVDADPQKTSYRWSTAKSFGFETIVSGKKSIPEIIKSSYKSYDYIIIDCPPSAESEITYSSLLMADIIIIPMSCTPPDLWATIAIKNVIDKAKIVNKNLKSFILINRYQPKLTVSSKVLEKISELGIKILKVKIGQRTAFVESAAQGSTVFELKDKNAILEIEKLTEEVLSF